MMKREDIYSNMAGLFSEKLTFKKSMCRKGKEELVSKDYVKERQGPVRVNRRSKGQSVLRLLRTKQLRADNGGLLTSEQEQEGRGPWLQANGVMLMDHVKKAELVSSRFSCLLC